MSIQDRKWEIMAAFARFRNVVGASSVLELSYDKDGFPRWQYRIQYCGNKWPGYYVSA